MPHTVGKFYNNLFRADPALKPALKDGMKDEGRKFMRMIGVAVDRLDELETLVPILNNFAGQSGVYGINQKRYKTVRAAFFKTLEEGLGDDFTAEVKDAWSSVCKISMKPRLAA